MWKLSDSSRAMDCCMLQMKYDIFDSFVAVDGGGGRL